MRKAGPDSQGDYTLINPPPETIFEEQDRLLVIFEDEDSYQPGISHAPEHAQYVPNMEKHSKQVLKILICGWRNDLQDVLRLIDNNVARGSEVIILSTKDEAAIKELKLGSSLHNVKLNYKYGDPLSMKVLEKLPLEQYDKSIILSDQNDATSSHSSTTTAMYIRHIQVQRGRSNSVIVAELPSSQEGVVQQVQKTWLNDSVQPEQLQAMVLAHLAEDSDVGAVLDEVVSDYGSNMISRSISAYSKPGEAFNFWDLQARAQHLGDIVIAHKCAEHENRWELNPLNKNEIIKWSEDDQVLVLTRPQV